MTTGTFDLPMQHEINSMIVLSKGIHVYLMRNLHSIVKMHAFNPVPHALLSMVVGGKVRPNPTPLGLSHSGHSVLYKAYCTVLQSTVTGTSDITALKYALMANLLSIF